MTCAPDPTAADAVAFVMRMAARAAQALQDLPQRLHPGWLSALQKESGPLLGGAPDLLNDILQQRFDLRWPDLSCAGHALELSWLLPVDDLRRLCASRALHADRGLLSRSVDAAERRCARQLVGHAAFDALMDLPTPRGRPRRLHSLEPDTVVIAGWALLASALPWRDVRSRRMAELLLPPAAARARRAFSKTGPRARPGAGASSDADVEHGEFAAALPHVFPEHLWLYGSEPARLTSG